MLVTFESIVVGNEYSRPNLAILWGYDDWHAIGRGIVTPRNTNYIILFITNEKQETLTQYSDSLDHGILSIDGEKNHQSDSRLVESQKSVDEVHLFYRELHHTPFTYYGLIELVNFTINSLSPSRFYFKVPTDLPDNDLETEFLTHGTAIDEIIHEIEGRKKIERHIRYERNRKNREQAIKIHGKKCMVCGFDFNEKYGNELADGYIEVHHIESVSNGLKKVNPEKDLIPLCSNCHSMAHRRRGKILTPDQIKEAINRNRKIS